MINIFSLPRGHRIELSLLWKLWQTVLATSTPKAAAALAHIVNNVIWMITPSSMRVSWNN